MILISGYDVNQINTSQLSDLEKGILNQKKNSSVTYRYDSPEALEFELKMRAAIVESARAFNTSGVRFATFKNSRSNKQFWLREEDGGLRLKSGVLSSDGINDIFQNGRLYAFECATAMVVILYKAILTAIHKEAFNTYFRDLLLIDWNYDSNLRLITTDIKDGAYLGDILYFKNPDHAPETPEWQGENAVKLGDDLYFGHGMGIRKSKEIISFLNGKRIPGSTTSASLWNEVIHPDFEYLRTLSSRGYHPDDTIVGRIGTHHYIYKGRM